MPLPTAEDLHDAGQRGKPTLPSRRQFLTAAGLAPLTMVAGPPPAAAQRPDVVFVPTPHENVERMLRLAGVGAGDVVIDLGSGDGRIPIAAARQGAARAIGVEIEPALLRKAQAAAEAAGLAGRVSFRGEDLFKTSLDEATVITLYLLPELNVRLAPRLLALRPGTRVVSHLFAMGDWAPDATDSNGGLIYLWIVPARVDGRWQVSVGGTSFPATFSQRYQEISGTAEIGGRKATITAGRLRAETIEFTLEIGGQPTRFRGAVSENAMRASAGTGGFGAPRYAADWSARRM